MLHLTVRNTGGATLSLLVHSTTATGLEIVTNLDMNLRTVPAIACKWVQEMYPTILWSWGVLPTCTWKGGNKKVINGRAHTTLLPSPSVQPFSPLFPANSILKTDIDTKPPETHTGAYWSYWGLWPAPLHITMFSVLILICNTYKNLTFSCSSQSHSFPVPALVPM